MTHKPTQLFIPQSEIIERTIALIHSNLKEAQSNLETLQVSVPGIRLRIYDELGPDKIDKAIDQLKRDAKRITLRASAIAKLTEEERDALEV